MDPRLYRSGGAVGGRALSVLFRLSVESDHSRLRLGDSVSARRSIIRIAYSPLAFLLFFKMISMAFSALLVWA